MAKYRHFQKNKVKESKVAQSCPTLCDPMDCSLPGLLRPWDSPGKCTGVGCHFLLQNIDIFRKTKATEIYWH